MKSIFESFLGVFKDEQKNNIPRSDFLGAFRVGLFVGHFNLWHRARE
jgi:hypothetical protein